MSRWQWLKARFFGTVITDLLHEQHDNERPLQTDQVSIPQPEGSA